MAKFPTYEEMAQHGTNLAEVGTDCISRKAAIDIIEDFPHGDVWNVESMEEMIDRIEQLPSAQPEPSQVARDIARIVENEQDMRILPKRGRWRHYEGVLKCSECASEFYDTIMEFCGDDVPHFCPDCGADMRGEQNE